MIGNHPMLRSRALSHDLLLSELPKVPTGLSKQSRNASRLCIGYRAYSWHVCSQHEHRLLLCQASASVSLYIMQAMPTSHDTPNWSCCCMLTLNTQYRLALQAV